mmetsp:Transcript_20436/g.28509  ORF Transcript_20436/g.28509 Transcript_20436/m.28509 type:complete len:270 (+) Transcript_20436:1538-2347(+)
MLLEMIEDHVIEVFTSEEGITVGRFHLKDSTRNFQNRDIEGTSTKVINSNGLSVLTRIHSVSKSSSCRLVDDSLDVQTRDLTRIFSSLTLAVIEISWNCDNCICHFFSEIILCGLFHLGEHEASNLTRGVLFSSSFNPSVSILVYDFERHELHVLLGHRIVKSAADQTLGSEDCVLGVLYSLTLSRGSNKHSIFCEGHEGGGSTRTLCILNNTDIFSFHNCHTRVGCAEVNTDDFTGARKRPCRHLRGGHSHRWPEEGPRGGELGRSGK